MLHLHTVHVEPSYPEIRSGPSEHKKFVKDDAKIRLHLPPLLFGRVYLLLSAHQMLLLALLDNVSPVGFQRNFLDVLRGSTCQLLPPT